MSWGFRFFVKWNGSTESGETLAKEFAEGSHPSTRPWEHTSKLLEMLNIEGFVG